MLLTKTAPKLRGYVIVMALSTMVLVPLLAASKASAQDLGPVMDRLERLERDIRTLNIKVSRGADAPGANTPVSAGGGTTISDAGISVLTQRLDNLEQDIRSATGSMEQLGHQIHQLTERLDKLVGDVDFRLGALEAKVGGGAAAVPTQATPPGQLGNLATPVQPPVSIGAAPGVGTVTASPIAQQPGINEPATQPQTLGTVSAKAVEAVQQQTPAAAGPAAGQPAQSQQAAASPAPLPAGSPKEQYTYALNLLRQTNYDQAEIALTEFIATQGEHPLAGNARYWLGETYYVRADYEQAAQTFFQGYQASPSNIKAPDMLLKLGMSLAQLKKKTEACATFDKLNQDFPRASTRINSAVTRERKRAGC